VTDQRDHLSQLREEEALVDEVEQTREELRAGAREKLGVTGETEHMPSLGDVLRIPGVTAYPLLALGVLSVVDTFQSYAFSVLTPEISRALGVGKGAIAGVHALKTLSIALAPLPVAALAQRRARRALLSIISAFVWSAVAISTGLVTLIWGLLLVLILDGLTTGSVQALHRPLLLDSYPPEGRVRALATYQGFNSAGNVIAPLLVAALSTYLGFTWRGVFVVLGVLSMLAAVTSLRLRDPGFGRWDTDRIRASVHERRHEDSDEHFGTVHPDEVALGFFEIVRRLMLIPTIRRVLVAWAVLGILLVPYQTFLFFFLDEEFGLGPGERGVFFAFLAAVEIVSLLAFGRRGEALFRREPGRLVELAASLLGGAVVLICIAGFAPAFPIVCVLFGIAAGMLAILLPALSMVVLSIIPSNMRPHAAALLGIFLGGVGGLLGALFLSGIDRRFGVAGSMVSLIIPGVLGSLILRSAKGLVQPDLDRMIDEVLEDEEIKTITASGGRLPMLACRGIDFSYGQLQVLFDCNLTVDDGELVALLGTNGAGKSTLLKVISGIGLPSSGSVRFRGTDITFLDAERRLRLGITQIPGGRAVFGPMTVADNLKAFGTTVRSDRAALDASIDRCFDVFPRLAERRNQLASTLSGGEQQMLGLSKALILKPRLLLIDELSLGLAPVIVGQLLDMVRQINADGTAVVLVEQSVNIALGLADHAYFMEKGEIRFDGPSAELLARDDLLRAVFLEGAGARNR
jgi:ABC-type branched-subunit amino acid transport system ATPase component/sugar phosphate permease